MESNKEKTTWVLDPSHSEMLFRVKHLMITNVKGEFRKFDAKVTTTGDDFSTAEVEVTIESDSIYTNDEARDKHLRSADFFDVENHRHLVFKSTSLEKKGDGDYKLTGMLGIRGVDKEVTLDVEFGGINKDPYGNHKAGFSLSGKINRKDWGLNWNTALETGGVLVSDEVRLMAEIQFTRQAN
jgi:polyisoprenoid-binding protein YceI